MLSDRCGLVALSMASSCTENFVNVEQVFNEATRRMFTNQGEMFSVHNMAILAKEFVSLNVEEITTSSEKNRNYLLDQLSSGSLLLIPYPFLLNNCFFKTIIIFGNEFG